MSREFSVLFLLLGSALPDSDLSPWLPGKAEAKQRHAEIDHDGKAAMMRRYVHNKYSASLTPGDLVNHAASLVQLSDGLGSAMTTEESMFVTDTLPAASAPGGFAGSMRQTWSVANMTGSNDTVNKYYSEEASHKYCNDEAWKDGKKKIWCQCMADGTLNNGNVSMKNYIKCDDDGTPLDIDPDQTKIMLNENPPAACDIIELSTYCMKREECLGKSHIEACEKDKQTLKDCDVKCSGAYSNAFSLVILLLAVMRPASE